MAERLHPGIYVEERRRNVAPITGVSTSTYGTAGFTLRGPEDEAILVTSFEQYERQFGGFTDQSGVPLHLFAFFANGGRRAYVVRTVAADAVSADGFIANPITEEIAATAASLNKVWQIDDPAGAPVFVDETTDFNDVGAGDVDPWPAVEAVGDQFAIGLGQKFTKLTLTVGTAGTVGSLTWKYWNGAAWVALAGVTDGTTGFTVLGANTVEWTLPADWAPRVLNGSASLYYVVAEVAVVYTINPVLSRGFINNQVFSGTLAGDPVRASTVSFTYQEAGAAITSQDLSANSSPVRDGAALDFAGRIVVAGSAPIVKGSVTIRWSYVGPTIDTFTDPAKDGILKDAGGNIRGYIDYKTGAFSLSAETGQAPIFAAVFEADYTPVSVTTRTVIDNGAGALTGAQLSTNGTINYTTGAWQFSVAAAAGAGPHDAGSILVAYTQNAWDIDPISRGLWGNDVRVDVRGNGDSFSRTTASYTRWDVNILLEGEVLETYTDLSLTDASDPDYLISAINDPNEGSDLITLVDPANASVAPDSLNGKARTRAAGAGNGSNQNYGSTGTADPDGYPDIPVTFRTLALETPVQPGSVSITYTDSAGVARTITDNGSGSLIGDVDTGAPSGFNRVNYTNGKFAFRTSVAVSVGETSNLAAPTGPVPGSIVTVAFRKTPIATGTQNSLTGGSDGSAGITRAELTSPTLLAERKGMYALLLPDELLNVGIPDAAGDVTMSTDQVTEAERNGKWFIILASPPGQTPQEVRDWRRFTLGISSSYAALYWPYIRVTDPFSDRGANIPPIGHIAGIYARTDTTKNVSKAPAGTNDGKLNFCEGLAYKVEFAEIDTFFPAQVNALVDTTQTGRCVWGARSLENPPSDFKYLQVRRMFNFLKTSIFNGTHGFVFEDVGVSLRQGIQSSTESFLRNLFNQGYFKGKTFSDAVNVICDETNNPPSIEEAGEVICDVWVAANKPGEFIVFRIQQKFVSAG